MTKKWIAINLILLAVAVLLGWQLNNAVKRFEAENDTAKVQPPKKKASPDAGLPAVQPPRKFSETEFAAIRDQNVFAEVRRSDEPTDAAAANPTVTMELKDKPVLLGVVVSGSQRMAMIMDPTAAGARSGRVTQTMRLGDNYRGFVVTDIREKEMVLEFGSSKEIIPLYDPSKQRQSGKTPILSTRVVSFGPAPSGGTAVASATTSGRPAAQQTPASTTQGRGQTANPSQQPAGGRGAVQGTGQPAVQAYPPTTLYPNQYIDSQGRIVTQSPFGPIIQNPPQQQPPAKK